MAIIAGGMNRFSSVALTLGTNSVAPKLAPLASITVFQAGGIVPLVLYAKSDGSQPLANPFVADINGRYNFYCVANRVDVLITPVVGTAYTSGDLMALPQVPSTPYANFPPSTPTDVGALIRRSDGPRGLWMDSGAGWGQVGGNVASVLDFGAKGDGVTDDTLAIQATIDSVSLLPQGGTVLFPAGVYLCNTSFVISTGPTVTGLFGIKADNVSLVGMPGSLIKNTVAVDVCIIADGAAKAGGGWNNAWIPFTWANTVPLYAIATAALGDGQVVCTTPAQALNFTPGDYIFIKTGELLGVLDGSTNEPDSEVNQVVSVNGGTGAIVLRWPLAKPYAQENYVAGNTGVTAVGGGGGPAPFGVCKVNANTITNISITGLQFDVTCASALVSFGRAVNINFSNNVSISDAIVSSSGNYRKGTFFANRVHSRGINFPAGVSAEWWFSTATGTTDAEICDNVCSCAAPTASAFMHIHEGSAQVFVERNVLLNAKSAGVFPGVNVASRGYAITVRGNIIINSGSAAAVIVQPSVTGTGLCCDNIILGSPSQAASYVIGGTPWVFFNNNLNGELDVDASFLNVICPTTHLADVTVKKVNPQLLLNDTGAGVPSVTFDLNSVFKTSITLDRANTRLALDLADYGVFLGTGQIVTLTGGKLGFYQKAPVLQQVLATGAAHSVDDVITFLQLIGLCKQA